MARQPSPFDGIERMVERMNRQLESLTRTVDLDLGGGLDIDWSPSDLTRTTGLDLADRGESFVVTIDVPGYAPSDIELTLTDAWLKIRGEREETIEEADDTSFIRRERRDRSFHRQVHLPEPVDVDEVEATVNNGVLTVTLGKLEGDTQGRSIEIE